MLQSHSNTFNRKFSSNKVPIIQLLLINPGAQRFLDCSLPVTRRPLMNKQVEIEWSAMFFDGKSWLVDNTVDTN
jgi:hypothetical protein